MYTFRFPTYNVYVCKYSNDKQKIWVFQCRYSIVILFYLLDLEFDYVIVMLLFGEYTSRDSSKAKLVIFSKNINVYINIFFKIILSHYYKIMFIKNKYFLWL